MVILGIDHVHRVSEFALFGPNVTDVSALDGLELDSLHFIKAFEIKYRQWKGRQEAENKARIAFPMIVHHTRTTRRRARRCVERRERFVFRSLLVSSFQHCLTHSQKPTEL